MKKNEPYNFTRIKNNIKDFFVNLLSEDTGKLFKEDTFFIVRNIHSRFSIYISSKLLDEERINEKISEQKFSQWIDSIELISDDFIYDELKETSEKINNQLYFNERRIDKTNWFTDKKEFDNIISFYSFKGGVGRTTAMILSAISLARKGEKVVLVDFDLEAPGLASIFSNNENNFFTVKGVLDYIIDLSANNLDQSKIDFNDYYFSITDQKLIGTNGGEILVFPAAATETGMANDYIDKISKADFKFNEYKTFLPDLFFESINSKLKPSYIFIDSRTGINDIGGILLNRFASKIFLFFYGTHQNMFGLEAIINIIGESKKPFFLVNTPVPEQETDRKEELEFFLNSSYNILSRLYYNSDNNIPDINDESADHYPINIPFNKIAVNLNSYDKISSLLYDGGTNNPYNQIAQIIESDKEERNLDKERSNLNRSFIEYFSRITPESVAASEEEFKVEKDLIQNFYPRKDYKYIFDQNKFLILGDKGIGKTALYSVLSHPNYAKNLAKYCGISKEAIEMDYWISAYDRSRESPSRQNLIGLQYFTISQIQNYWLILLLRSYLKSNLQDQISVKIDIDIVNCKLSELKKYAQDASIGEKIEEYLEEINNEAILSHRILYFVYDYLDLNLPKESNFRGKSIGALLSLWYDYTSRFSNIKAKIFLRNDIFNVEVETETDKVKIRNHSVSINWTYDQLLNIVWKRILSYKSENQAIDELFDNFKHCINEKHEEELGLIPELGQEENRQLLDLLFGKYIGSNNKTFPYNWIIYHVSDAAKKMFPRSVLTLFATTGRNQENDQKESKTPFRPYNMEIAMDQVSNNRVDDLKEEYPDLRIIFEKLHTEIEQLPIQEEELIISLKKIVKDLDPLEIIKKLSEIGVLYPYKYNSKKYGKRYHMPDLYLFGMNIKRRGPGAHKTLFS